jgi:dienelactone hydrolase
MLRLGRCRAAGITHASNVTRGPTAVTRRIGHLRTGRVRMTQTWSCLVGLLVLLAACWSTNGAGGSSAAPTGVDCGSRGRPGPAVMFRSQTNRKLRGVIFGKATATVVLAHQSNQTLCDELDLARQIAAQGMEAFAFDVGGDAPAPVDDPLANYQTWDRDVVAAIAVVRSRGATRTLLLGASQGGCAVLVAATEVTPAPTGVVSLSGEQRVADLDCDAAATRYTGALLVVASANDRYLDSAAAQGLVAESPSQDKRALVLPGTAHGFALLAEDDVLTQVVSFLREHSS